MAKKVKKAAKAAKAPAKKAASKKKAAKSKAAATAPRNISTGKGANVAEIANQFVEMYRSGTADAKIWDAVFAKNWTSIEGFGMGMAFEGRKAIEAKCRLWMDNHEVHGTSCDGPYLGATGFAVIFSLDVTDKSTGQRIMMKEAAVYSVLNGKIIQEEFMYGA
jgi:hypothetical protein